jgi:hypothetical protein
MQDGGKTYVVHTFTADGVFTPTSQSDGVAEVLVVAGGGGQGAHDPAWGSGGSGGAGGLIKQKVVIEAGKALNIVVGAGGGNQANGGNSSIAELGLIAIGGGHGGAQNQGGPAYGPSTGGSGGAGTSHYTSTEQYGPGAAGTAGQGNAGSDGRINVGGGAGSDGANGGNGLTVWGKEYAKGGRSGPANNNEPNTGNGANNSNGYNIGGNSGIVIIRYEKV